MGLAFTFGLATLIRGGLLTVFGYNPHTMHTDLVSGNTARDPMLVQIQGGQVKAIAPKDSAQAEIIYPLAALG